MSTVRWMAIAGVALLAGCMDLTGLIDGRPPSIVERDGLSYQVIVSESRYDADRVEYRLRITNTSSRTIERWLPDDLAYARVYRDGRWGRPVWSECEWGCDRRDRGGIGVRLRRGEAVEGWWGEVRAREFADYRSGTYHLVLDIDTGRHHFEVLGLPEIRVR